MLLLPRFIFLSALSCTVILPGAWPALSSAGSIDYSSGEAKKSKRIEVYLLSQNYWDTRYGDNLSSIVLHLLPNNPAKHAALIQEIVQMNPHAFINGDPARLLAGKRLWLPGNMMQADTPVDPERTTVETYSWGNIKRRK